MRQTKLDGLGVGTRGGNGAEGYGNHPFGNGAEGYGTHPNDAFISRTAFVVLRSAPYCWEWECEV